MLAKTGSRASAGVLCGVALAFLALFVFSVARFDYWPWPTCVFHELTGLHCPGCGITRAAIALSHGELVAALGFNALAFLLAPILVWGVASDARRWMRREPMRGVVLDARWITAIVVAVLAFAVLRNLPFAPFAWLAP